MKYDYVFDTYVWAEFFDGTEKGKNVIELLKSNIATSMLVIAELSDKCAREKRELEPLIKFIQSKAAIIPFTQSIALNSGDTKLKLREYSKNISLADAIHFQTANEFSAIFVTGDNDFKNVKNILFL